jgi:hypothetical protein
MSCDCNTLVVGEAGAPGPQGLAGINGTNGTNGINAFTTVIAPAQIQPAIGSTVTFYVAENRWMTIGQTIYIEEAGFYRVTVPDPNSPYSQVTAELLNFDGVNQGASIPVGSKVSPSSAVSLTTGTFNTLAVSAGGLSNLDGPVVINESGGNFNFRVEGDNDQYLLFCDANGGTNGRVGISTDAPEATLHVDGTFKVGTNIAPGSSSFIGPVTVNNSQLGASDFLVKGEETAETFFVDVSENRVGIGTYTPGSLLDVAGSAQAISFVVNPGGVTSPSAATFRVNGTNSTVPIYVKSTSSPLVNAVGIFNTNPTASLDVTGTAVISGATSVVGTLSTGGATSVGGTLGVTGATTLSNNLSVGGATALSNSLTVGGATSLATSLSVTGAASLTSTLAVNGNTTIGGNVVKVDTEDNFVGINKTTPTVELDVVGETKISSNLFVNTDNFVVDADNHRVGVNTDSPTVALDVVGAANISGNTTIGSDILKVNSSNGYVGINKATPTVALDVDGQTKISSNLFVNTDDFVVDADNHKVGINTDSPTVALDVIGSVQASDYRISTGSGAAKLTGFYYASHTASTISSIAAGATTAITGITVTGAALGDFVQVTYTTLPGSTFKDVVTVSGYVSATDTVAILLANNSVATPTTAQTNLPFNILVTRAAAS